jgi:hypothetical protein
MAKKVKCPMCKTLNNREDTVTISNRYYCVECADKREEEKARNKDNWDELFDYICDLYNIDTLTGLMFKQIKDFRDNYNYTNKGMYLTLKYYYETLDNEVKDNTGLGIIIYYYEQAKQHFIESKEVKKHLGEFEIDEHINIVKIKKIDIDDYEYKKQLSLDDTTWDEEEVHD